MKSKVISLFFFHVVMIGSLTACSPLPWDDPVCKPFFVRRDVDEDYVVIPSIPTESARPQTIQENDEKSTTSLSTEQTLSCEQDGKLLETETVIVEQGSPFTRFSLSPDSHRLFVEAFEQDFVFDLASNEKILMDKTFYAPTYWIDENTILTANANNPWEMQDMSTGISDTVGVRWEFNGVSFDKEFYTGWQAAEQLGISDDEMCQAIKEGVFSSVLASDGSSIIPGSEISGYSLTAARKTVPNLLTYDEIAQLRRQAKQIRSVIAGAYFPNSSELNAPIKHAFWHRALILQGLPTEPHNLIIFVTSPSHWETYPEIPSQILINIGGIRLWEKAHPKFEVGLNQCNKNAPNTYTYALFRKGTGENPPIQLGVIPYPVAYGPYMVWSPDFNYIYFIQAADGNYSISRIALAQFEQ